MGLDIYGLGKAYTHKEFKKLGLGLSPLLDYSNKNGKMSCNIKLASF